MIDSIEYEFIYFLEQVKIISIKNPVEASKNSHSNPWKNLNHQINNKLNIDMFNMNSQYVIFYNTNSIQIGQLD